MAMWRQTISLFISLVLVTAILLAATTGTAHAYIDIATGSFLIQMLVAVGFSSLLAIKIFWQRLVGKASAILSRVRGTEPKVK